jgi:hypothetical protein
MAGPPGTDDVCLGCGPVGSAAYITCHMAVAAKVGSVPDCAKAGIAKNQKDIADANIPLLSGLEQAIVNLQDAVKPLTDLNKVFANIPRYGIKIGLFMFALMLVIVGFWVLTQNPGEGNSE